MEPALLELRQVSKTFQTGNTKPVKAVQSVSFEVPSGINTGIVGESGCGKSTLARMITGLTGVTSGEILLNGTRISGLRRSAQRDVYRQVQMVFQDPYSAISPRMPVGTFLTEGLVHFGLISKGDRKEQARKLLELVDLDPQLALRLPHQLSGGQLQRVVIARAISIHPRLVILDEATSALDVSVQKQILSLLVRLQEEFSLTYLFIGHDLAVVRSITEQIFVMKEGSIVERLPSETLQEDARHPYTLQLLSSVFSVKDLS
ncbi:MAG: ABC transporter ATP-binding protein [Parasporobacterium sp.]|nr:ABC transporter ATP-binding protein [Parasporobacterium sp.]